MKLQQSYEHAYLAKKGGKTYLMMRCPECSNTEKLHIVPQAGIVDKICEACGRLNRVVINEVDNNGAVMNPYKETVHPTKLFRYMCNGCMWGHTTTHYDLLGRLKCPDCGSKDFDKYEIDMKTGNMMRGGVVSTLYNHKEKGGNMKMTDTKVIEKAEALLEKAEAKLKEMKDQTIGAVGGKVTVTEDSFGNIIVEKSDEGKGYQLGASNYDGMEINGKKLSRLSTR